MYAFYLDGLFILLPRVQCYYIFILVSLGASLVLLQLREETVFSTAGFSFLVDKKHTFNFNDTEVW